MAYRSAVPTSDPIALERLRDILHDVAPSWWRVDVVEATESTNADVAGWARDGVAEGAVLVTDNQVAGRGRFTRSWVTPPGMALATSLLLRPRVDAAGWGWLSLVAGLAVRDALVALDVPAELKWPNDVLVADRKLCGILSERVESSGLGQPTAAAVVGIGINMSQDRSELPVPTATSLRLEGCQASKTDVMAALLTAFEGWYQRWTSGEDLRGPYAGRCATVGREVRVQLTPTTAEEGRCVGVDEHGRLLVETQRGVTAFAAGDVFHLRPGAP